MLADGPRDKTMAQVIDRRLLLRMLGGVVLLASGGLPSFAQNGSRIAQLIHAARGLEPISARIDLISRAFLGTRYRGNTLIGGPQQPERFVVRDDAFDCVTFCETVLAMARSRSYEEFETALKTIRYANAVVRWDERNHYFADWNRRAIENEIVWPVDLSGSVTLDKTVNWGNLGRRQVAMLCTPAASLLARPSGLASGDIIGFLSRRPGLDFFHTGFVVLSADREPILRHASQSRRRVLDEPLSRFLDINRVQYATVLRPLNGRRV
jgi:Protein of unknown function (DUF1460)